MNEGIILDNHSFCVTILVCCELCLAMLLEEEGVSHKILFNFSLANQCLTLDQVPVHP